MNGLNEILLNIINMSVTAGIIIMTILPIRYVLSKAPKVFSYMLWGVVLFRLLCPLSFSSEFSLLNVVNVPITNLGKLMNIPTDIDSTDVVPTGVVSTNFDSTDIASTDITSIDYLSINLLKPKADNPFIHEGLSQSNEELTAKPLVPAIHLLTYIWFIGIGLFVVYSILSLMKIRKQISCSMPLKDNVYIADNIPTPFVFGLFRPRIYLPSYLAMEEREYIVLHEKFHIHRFDHVVKLLAFATLCLHWFNPLVWFAFHLAMKDMEMSCDEAVLRKLGDGIKADYSMSLLHLATGKKFVTELPLAFGEGDTKGRIKNVMKYKAQALWIIVTTMIVCILVAVWLLANPIIQKENNDAPGKPSDNNIITKIVTEEPRQKVGKFKLELLAYRNMTYKDFLASGGSEAEFYHAGRYITYAPNLNAKIIFLGQFDENTADFSLSDTDVPLRLQGSIQDFFDGVIENLSQEQFLEYLSEQYTITHTKEEGAGTAYYIADHYLRVNCDITSDGNIDIILDISLENSEIINADTYCWVTWYEQRDK